MTIAQLLKCLSVEGDDAHKLIAIAAYGHGMTIEHVNNLPLEDVYGLYTRALEAIADAVEREPKASQQLTIGGKLYTLQADVQRMTAGRWADIQGALANKDANEAALNVLALLLDDDGPYRGGALLGLREHTDSLPAAVGVAALSFFDRRIAASKLLTQLYSTLTHLSSAALTAG